MPIDRKLAAIMFTNIELNELINYPIPKAIGEAWEKVK
tara:strand:- start:66 stop:179 length:114 start_codon:yes stop_codon:yes gene_type:complete